MTKAFHGQKRYLQLLLHPHRSELLDQLAEERGVRVTALVRDMVYEALQRTVSKAGYAAAVAQDDALRAEAIRRQTEGRKRKPA